MNNGQRVTKLLERWGQNVDINTANGEKDTQTQQGRAFIQPLRYKNKMYLGGSFLPPGYSDGGHYLYIGSAQQRIDLAPFDTVIRTKQDSYVIKRAEKVCLDEEILYIWAVLQRYAQE